MATVRSAIAAAGKSGVRPAFKSYWANIIRDALSRTIDPQSAVGGCIPTPRKESAAIVRNTKQNLSPNSAIKGGMIFGKISRRIIQPSPSPRKRAAST